MKSPDPSLTRSHLTFASLPLNLWIKLIQLPLQLLLHDHNLLIKFRHSPTGGGVLGEAWLAAVRLGLGVGGWGSKAAAHKLVIWAALVLPSQPLPLPNAPNEPPSTLP